MASLPLSTKPPLQDSGAVLSSLCSCQSNDIPDSINQSQSSEDSVSLVTLPDEILVEIFEEVDHTPKRWHDSPDLLNLMSTSSRFYRIAYPLLYRNVSLSNCQLYLLPLAYRVFADPGTASLVRSFDCPSACPQQPVDDETIEIWRQKRYDRSFKHVCLSAENDRRGWPAEQNLDEVLTNQIEDVFGWAEDQRSVSSCFKQIRWGQRLDVVLMMMLPKLVNLERLELQPLGMPLNEAYRHVFHKSLELRDSFSKLTDACFAYEGQDRLSQSILPDLLRLPAIKRLTAWSTGTRKAMKTYLETEICKVTDKRPNIEQISMHRCGLTTKTIHHILGLCPNLESLMFSFRVRRYTTPYNTDDLSKALEQRKDTLYRLWLGYDLGTDLRRVDLDDLRNIKGMSFRDFTNLEDLSIAAPLVLGGAHFLHRHFFERLGITKRIRWPDVPDTQHAFADALPMRLVVLTVELVFDDFTAARTAAALAELVKRKGRVCPLLRQVNVRLGDLGFVGRFDLFLAEAKKAGVETSVALDGRHVPREQEAACEGGVPVVAEETGVEEGVQRSPSVFAEDLDDDAVEDLALI